MPEGDSLSVLEDLGFESEASVAVVHVDDVGMCRAANAGALAAFEGAATCGSVMVPCSAFEEIAALAREQPELDLGIHLTLNCEYDDYRWGPVDPAASSLQSSDGGMWRSVDETVENGTVEDVEIELRAQIERAAASGIDITHLDSHMGSIFHPKFVEVYFKLALEFELPVFIPRVTREVLERTGMPESLERYVEIIDGAEAMGFPIFDAFDNDSLQFEPGQEEAHNVARADSLGAGLTYLITHCAVGDAELQGITPDWQQRDGEYQVYSDGRMGAHFERLGVKTIGMRPLRDRLRSLMNRA